MRHACAFVAGAWWLQQQAALPPLGAASLVVVAWLAAVAWTSSPVPLLRRAAPVLAIAGWCAAGFFWAAFVATWKLSDELPRADERRDLRVSGVVQGLPEPGDHGWRFGFRVDRNLSLDGHAPAHLMLAWYARDAVPAQSPVAPGERLEFTVRLKRPHGAVNPHGFDREAWFLEQGIRAAGYVNDREPVVRGGFDRWSPAAWIDRARGRMRDRLLAAAGDAPFGGVLVALAVGDQRAIPAGQWDLFTRTGVNHLMSISGLHITMLAALAHAVVIRFRRHFPGRADGRSATDAAMLAGFAVALVYSLLAGFAVPAQRTLWMLGVTTLATRLRVFADPGRTLAAALLLVVVLDPMAVISAGFWLSFGAVALLTGFVARPASRFGWFAAWSRAQWVLFVGLAPLLIGLFQQVSLVSPAANAFAVPVVSLVVVPLALVATVSPWAWPAQLANGLMTWVAGALAWLAQLPGARWVQAAPPDWAVVLALAGAACLLLPRGFPSRWLGTFGFLPLLFAAPALPAEGEARVTVLDVGQGLAVFVRTAHESLLFDAGAAWGDDTDSGAAIVVPFLRGEGVSRLGALVVSHDDRDHTGGVASVLRQVPADWVLASLPPTHAALRDARRVVGCAAGQSWSWSGVRFAVLHPAYRPDAGKLRDNARSCVLRIDAGGHSALVAADIEADSERDLLTAGATLSADVLVVPHHGSRTSSTDGFVAAVRPSVAVMSLGYRNRFGHPHPDVDARYRRAGVTIVRTDRDGAVAFTLGPRPPVPDLQRHRARRYWHDGAGP